MCTESDIVVDTDDAEFWGVQFPTHIGLRSFSKCV